jgi:hypothetical protein
LTIEEGKAPNRDQADITWQADDATLDHAAPPTARTTSGNKYEIRHSPDGAVEIVMYGNGNGVLYTRIDPNASPNKKRNGILISDAPDDQTLVRQAARSTPPSRTRTTPSRPTTDVSKRGSDRCAASNDTEQLGPSPPVTLSLRTCDAVTTTSRPTCPNRTGAA